MGSNSIRANLSKAAIISDIRMSLSADLKSEKSVIVVEGQDDIQFWKNKLSDDTYLYESFSGRVGVHEIVKYFKKPKVIGICDRDYGDNLSQEYIFYYDYSCLEMMLIHNDNAFQSFFSEYYHGTHPDDFRLSILMNLKWISCFRQLNHIHSWGINFNGFSIANAFDGNTTCFDNDKALTELASINKNFYVNHRDKLATITYSSEREFSLCDLLDLTNGHDFLCFMHCSYESKKGPKGKTLGIDALSASLRCSFRMADFIHTVLYSKLREFEQSNQIVFLAA